MGDMMQKEDVTVSGNKFKWGFPEKTVLRVNGGAPFCFESVDFVHTHTFIHDTIYSKTRLQIALLYDA